MVLPQRCCLCCNLRIGAFLLGWAGIIHSIVVFSFIAKYILKGGGSFDFGNKFIVVCMYITIFILMACTLLLIGIHVRKRVYLLPWLKVQMCIIVGCTLVMIPVAMFYFGASIFYGILVGFIGFLIIGVQLYWWLCMLSLFMTMRQESSITVGVVYENGAAYENATYALTEIPAENEPRAYAFTEIKDENEPGTYALTKIQAENEQVTQV